jgi:hypothetical protein
MKHSLFLIFSLLTMFASGICASEEKIYRWQDDAGVWHSSATPPANPSVEAINIKAPPTSGTMTNNNKEKKEKEKESDGNQTTTDSAVKKSAEVAAEDKALAQKNCQNARANLENLKNHRRMRINDEETGEVRYLSNDEHDEWTKRSKEEVRKYCQ